MSDKDTTPQVKIEGDGQVTGDDSPAQMIKAGGDVSNVTQIGKIVVQFVDEKVFKRFGLEQRAGFVLLAILIVVIGVGGPLFGYRALQPRPPERMDGEFRIAIAGFAERGQSDNSEIGTELAQSVYLRMEQTFDEIDMDATITIWGPDQVGTISGQDSAERANAAAQIAQEIGAIVVVYGLVDTTDSAAWQIVPEFYISAENFYEADEITGQHNIGAPFSAKGQGDFATRRDVSKEFTSRAQAIAGITAGLAYYSSHDFEEALAFFESVEELAGWEESEGKQVLYLLIGNAAGKIRDFELAEMYHQKSLELDSEYARAYVGLASIYYIQALKPYEETGDPTQTDLNLLNLAIATYKQAAEAAHQPTLADILTKVHFSLGQCYFMLVYSENEELFNPAIAEFEAVIEEYGNGANLRIRELAAESHARLGAIYALTGHEEWAVEEYEMAASLLDKNPDRQNQYRNRAESIKSAIDNVP